MNTIKLMAALLALSSSQAISHDLLPGQAQGPMLIRNATIHSASATLENHDLLIESGRISAIGPQLPLPEQAQQLDASGKHIYPALIALDSQLGLTEIGAVRATVDTREVGDINPQLRAASAYNIESEVLPTLRANGIGYAQLTPKGSMLAGRSALVKLDGWTVHQAMVQADSGVHLYWPSDHFPQGEEYQKALSQYQDKRQQIEQAFADAQLYLQAPRAQVDTRWQGMTSLFAGQTPLFVHANSQRQIEHAMQLAEQYQFQLVIVGGYDSYRLADRLAEAEVAVIFTHAKGLPQQADQPYDLAFRIPAMLADAGVEFALAASGSWSSRNLAFVAGQAIAFGLTEQQALAAITSTPAAILGLPKLGHIEVGAPASLLLASGDLFDPASHGIEAMWLDGKAIDLDNRHQRLYQKYQQRQAPKAE